MELSVDTIMYEMVERPQQLVDWYNLLPSDATPPPEANELAHMRLEGLHMAGVPLMHIQPGILRYAIHRIESPQPRQHAVRYVSGVVKVAPTERSSTQALLSGAVELVRQLGEKLIITEQADTEVPLTTGKLMEILAEGRGLQTQHDEWSPKPSVKRLAIEIIETATKIDQRSKRAEVIPTQNRRSATPVEIGSFSWAPDDTMFSNLESQDIDEECTGTSARLLERLLNVRSLHSRPSQRDVQRFIGGFLRFQSWRFQKAGMAPMWQQEQTLKIIEYVQGDKPASAALERRVVNYFVDSLHLKTRYSAVVIRQLYDRFNDTLRDEARRVI